MQLRLSSSSSPSQFIPNFPTNSFEENNLFSVYSYDERCPSEIPLCTSSILDIYTFRKTFLYFVNFQNESCLSPRII